MAVLNFFRRYFKSILVYGVFVSGISALGEWCSFALMVYVCGLYYLLSSILSFLLGTTINAILSRKVAFHSKGRSGSQETFLIYLTSALAFLVNIGTLAISVEVFHWPAMVGKIAGTVFAFFANYALRQFFIFSSTPRW
ncbi:MAG TPA: GtrA family protein [Fibrobacteraceae bacterium]|nr:GtrA family protein [Fibrobacteraceae bacterium]